MENQKIGVYICTGCGIGECLDMEALAKVAASEYKVPICKTHASLCSSEGIGQIKGDIEKEGVNSVVIAACSIRAKTEVFSFDPASVLTERVNLREQGVWSHCPREEASSADTDGQQQEKIDEDLQMLAEDGLRMGIVRIQKSDLPEPFTEETSKTIMVVGGGPTGMAAARGASLAGYEVLLVEKEAGLGGFMNRLYRQLPTEAPYQRLKAPDHKDMIREVEEDERIKVLTSAKIERTSGAPGMFEVEIRREDRLETHKVGAIVLAAGWQPYDAARLRDLGYGKYQNVVTNVMVEEMASGGTIRRPSDERPVNSVAFIQCAGSRDPEHLPYCSTVCCAVSLKQAAYVRNQHKDAKAYIIYKDMRTPGHLEHFYKAMQDDEGIFLTKGEVLSIDETDDKSLVVEVDDALLGERIKFKADLVVLAVGMVPAAAFGEPLVQVVEEDSEKKKDIASELLSPTVVLQSDILNLEYRQGPELPELRYGFPDSHFICFPYETRRTGIYAAGCVRQPMNIASCLEDARGAALKAIQCVEMTARGEALHPRAGDLSYPDLFMQRCTQCKRCTEECPFGMYNEDEKANPLPNPTRCRRCAICMGSCPERIISFKDYSVDMIGAMIKAIEVPEEEEEKPRILIFACENDAYPALDMAGIKRLSYNPYVRIIPLRCIGSLNLVWIADSMAKGIDGILLLGCKHGEDYQCHFIKGSELANYRLTKVKETLDRLVLEADRVRFEQVTIEDSDRLPALIDQFLERIEEVGPNPYKGF